MSHSPLINSPTHDQYTNNEKSESNNANNEVFLDIDDEVHIFGIKPHAPREDISIPVIEAFEKMKPHSNFSISNLLWVMLIGLWVSIGFFLTSLLFFLTGFYYKNGIYCLKIAKMCLFPFGKYLYREGKKTQTNHIMNKVLWVVFFPLYGIPSIIGSVVSWESVYFIPMSKILMQIIGQCFSENPEELNIGTLVNHNPINGHFPLILCETSGSWIYFRYTILSFEVLYINMFPLVILALVCGYLNVKGTILDDCLFGTFVSLFGAVPCAYVIGICVDDLSKQLGIIVGSIINALFLGLVELLLYYFSLKVGLTSVVRAAVTGAFLMNLLIIPGVAMLAAGLKWKEIILNKKAQAISGTYLLLAIIMVLFPSVFYNIHSHYNQTCQKCQMNNSSIGVQFNCSMCSNQGIQNIDKDPVYSLYAKPLNNIMAFLMPLVYILGVVFSVKTHPHIFVGHSNDEHEAEIPTSIAIVTLIIATILFSIMAHIMTEKIPHAIEQLKLSERFVGLIFYTLIPNAAEYINSIKFALNGNLGLSMELGNQAAILTALIEMPALVLLSIILYNNGLTSELFTLIFPMIDIFCIIIAVFLRNSILGEKSVNYSTGASFLIIFFLISVVYYFDVF